MSEHHPRGDEPALTLYFHPLSSFCMKVLIALYENSTHFRPHLVDLGDPVSAGAFKKIWPIGRFPVLRDDVNDQVIPESSIIIEYLAQNYPGHTHLVPMDADAARQTRLRDRFYDLYVHAPMQRIIGERLRPAGQKDPFGVDQAKALLQTALGMVETEMAENTWAMGSAFTLADCAAAPALFYANLAAPFEATHKNTAAYLHRLKARPSFARALEEAQPYFHLFPKA